MAIGTEMDYYISMLFLLLHLRLFKSALAFGLAVLISHFFFVQNHSRKAIDTEGVRKKQGPAEMCGAGF